MIVPSFISGVSSLFSSAPSMQNQDTGLFKRDFLSTETNNHKALSKFRVSPLRSASTGSTSAVKNGSSGGLRCPRLMIWCRPAEESKSFQYWPTLKLLRINGTSPFLMLVEKQTTLLGVAQILRKTLNPKIVQETDNWSLLFSTRDMAKTGLRCYIDCTVAPINRIIYYTLLIQLNDFERDHEMGTIFLCSFPSVKPTKSDQVSAQWIL